MSTCQIEGCENEARHTMKAFLIPIRLCCEHTQQRLEVTEKQIGVLSEELEARGFTTYGQQILLKGIELPRSYPDISPAREDP